MATWSRQFPEADPRDNCPCGSGYPVGVCVSCEHDRTDPFLLDGGTVGTEHEQ